MFVEKDLAEIRHIEEQLLQTAREDASFDLTHLVAIFTKRDNQTWLPIFNVPGPYVRPRFPEAVTLDELLRYEQNLLITFDGMVITFEALRLVRPDIVTRGSRFYPIEQLYRRLNQLEHLPKTQWHLAQKLYSILHAREEFDEQSIQYSPSGWLDMAAKIFRLSLPALLEQHPVEGLLAVVPDENFLNYLTQQQYTLVYAHNDSISTNAAVIDLEDFAHLAISTESQLYAAYSEVALFNQGMNLRAMGYVDLRREFRRGPYSTNIKGIIANSEMLKSTIKQLALKCYEQSITNNDCLRAARSLALEYWLADQELEDIAAIELLPNWITFAPSSLECTYYLTLPEGAPDGVDSLDTLLKRGRESKGENIAASLRSLSHLFSDTSDRLISISDILLKLDRPQVYARSTYLHSRLLYKMLDAPIDAEKVADDAAMACYMYSLAEPYYYYWPHGNHGHQLLQSYENFHEQVDKLIKITTDRQRKSYFHALQIWWDHKEHDVERRKAMLEEAVTELESIAPLPGESNEVYSAASKLYVLLSALLTMFSRTWQSIEAREKLRNAGYQHVVIDNIILLNEVLDYSRDPKQPSPLFLEKLRDFLSLNEESHMIRSKEHDSLRKAEQLLQIGDRLGQHIGIRFNQYRKTGTRSQIHGEDEELDNSLLLPEHERLWMRSLYYAAIDEHAAFILTLETKPVEVTVTPTEVTQFESTVIMIVLAEKNRDKIEHGMDVDIILSVSDDYDIQSRIVRKKFGTVGTVEFTIIFQKSGDIALLFEYIVDKKDHYQDEAWVHVIGLEAQAKRVKNPYRFGDVIISPANHYGRREELKLILDKLSQTVGDNVRQNFRLHGMRRAGKTSLLMMIRKAIEDQDTRSYFHIEDMADALSKWHPIFFTLEELPGETNRKNYLNSSVFFKSLIRSICSSFCWAEEAIDDILLRIDADLAKSPSIVEIIRKQLVHILKEVQPEERILILLDEVDLISPERDPRFFGHLRSLILSPELRRITWILTSVRVLQAARDEVESPLHNVFEPITLKNLDATEARRLILEPARKESIYFPSKATELILQQTGRQPFLLNVVCSAVIDQLNTAQSAYVLDSVVKVVIDRLLEPGAVIYEQCGFYWKWATRTRRVILALLAQHQQSMFRGDLIQAFQDTIRSSASLRLDTNTLFDGAWNELFANDLVTQDQHYFCRITIPLFQRWLQKRYIDLQNPR